MKECCKKTPAEHLAEMEKNILVHGWTAVYVEGESGMPAFCYTVGLSKNYAHPEVIAFGFNQKIANAWMNILSGEVKKGVTFETGRKYAGYSPLDLAFLEVPYHRELWDEYFGMAVRFNRLEAFRVLQMVWPDRNNKFPWDDGWDHGFDRFQPLLGNNDVRLVKTLFKP